MQAFDDQNAELARETKPETAVAGRSFDRIHDRLQRTGGDLPLAQAFALVTVAHRLMRVGDQAKNICEETLFELTGETKPPKRYEILFVDARDTLIAPLAVALARKAFPASGRYSSAGYRAGENLAPELVALAEELSLDLAGIDPTPLSTDPKQLEQYHVIVALAPDVRRQLGQVPYATVLLEWQLPGLADVASGGAVAGRLREVSQYLSNEISDLMVTMRGEDAG